MILLDLIRADLSEKKTKYYDCEKKILRGKSRAISSQVFVKSSHSLLMLDCPRQCFVLRSYTMLELLIQNVSIG